jgi:hypothetical protein
MTAAAKSRWLGIALSAALVYFAVGRLFAIPVTNVQFWRLAAWAISAAVFVAHIWYERSRLRNAASVAAFHVAAAAALGAFGLALVVVVRKLAAPEPVRPFWFLSLVLWPAITGIPAFLVAMVTGMVLVRSPRSANT